MNLKKSFVIFANCFLTIEELGKCLHYFLSSILLCFYIYTGLAFWKKLWVRANNNDNGPTQFKRQQSWPEAFFCYSLDRGNIPRISLIDFRNFSNIGVQDRELSAAARLVRHARRDHLVLESSSQLCVLLTTLVGDISWKQSTQSTQ